MTVYGKIENGEFVPAPYGEADYLISQGYSAFDDETAQKYITKDLLQSQIEELDQKRIRAGFEPSIKDESTGQTWLDYYNLQIVDLRTQIANLG